MQSQLANAKRENAQCEKYADDLEKAMILSEARHSSEIDTLSKKIEEFETLIAAQRLEIMELKDYCQNDHETNNHDILEPAAFSSIFTELKNSEYCTLGADHYAEQRHKFQTQNITTCSVDGQGNKAARYRSLGLNNVYDTCGDQTYHHVQRLVQLAAILTAKLEDAFDIEASLSEILSKVKFAVTDGALNMKAAMEKFGDWRKDITGSSEELVWIHCNAHVIPALDSGTESAAIEKIVDIRQSVTFDFNKSFIKPSESIIFTIFYALFNNIGPSSKSQDWSCKIQYNAFLKYKGEKEYRFFDPRSSRFGKNVEMGMILAYNFKYLVEFLRPHICLITCSRCVIYI